MKHRGRQGVGLEGASHWESIAEPASHQQLRLPDNKAKKRRVLFLEIMLARTGLENYSHPDHSLVRS